MKKYDEIIQLEHPVSKKHQAMPMANRAAQFLPFAALNGYDDSIIESGRMTQEMFGYDEERIEKINIRLQYLQEHKNTQIYLTYFEADRKKAGGAYKTVNTIIKKFDELHQMIMIEDGTRIAMRDIFEIESSCFE